MSNIRQLGNYELGQIRLQHDGGPEDAVAFFAAQDPAKLAVILVNDQLNDFIRRAETEGGEQPIDYQGWYWRSVDFFTPGGITVAEGDGRVAVCQSNKWDYSQRDLTPTEQATFRGLVWGAYRAGCQGGNLADIYSARDAELAKANEFIHNLDMRDAA